MVPAQAGFAFFLLFFSPFLKGPILSRLFCYVHFLIPVSAFEAVVMSWGLRSGVCITPCYLLFSTVFCTNLHFQKRNRGINAQAALVQCTKRKRGFVLVALRVLGSGMGTAARGHWGSSLLGVTAGFAPSAAPRPSLWAGDGAGPGAETRWQILRGLEMRWSRGALVWQPCCSFRLLGASDGMKKAKQGY